jgi:RNA polymerase sigma factor (sigma-70 family)
MTQTTTVFTGKSSKDKGFSNHFSYDDFSNPDLFKQRVTLPNEYMSRVNSFMVAGDDKQLYKIKGKPYNLSADQERILFTQFNYAKKRMIEAETQEQFDKWERIAMSLRDTIFNANVFLAPSVMKTINGWQVEAQDLCSEGLMGVMRAIHGFDVDRGMKFSTYAFRAIKQSMLRHIIGKQNRTAKVNQYNGEMIHQDQIVQDDKDTCKSEVMQQLQLAINGGVLDKREAQIFNLRFPTNGDKPLTLRALGKVVNLTAERVRQIQDEARDKLRMHMAENDLD